MLNLLCFESWRLSKIGRKQLDQVEDQHLGIALGETPLPTDVQRRDRHVVEELEDLTEEAVRLREVDSFQMVARRCLGHNRPPEFVWQL